MPIIKSNANVISDVATAFKSVSWVEPDLSNIVDITIMPKTPTMTEVTSENRKKVLLV